MSRIGQKDTSAEMLLRKSLFAKGLRYRLHVKKLPGKPDIVFPGRKVVVFVDGKFWHGYRWKALKRQLADKPFWLRKIKQNMARDKKANETLTALGWKVLRFWDVEIKKDREGCVQQIEEALLARMETSASGIHTPHAEHSEEHGELPQANC